MIGSNMWVNAWTKESCDDADIFKHFIQPFPDRMFCSSWPIPVGVSQIRIVEASKKNLEIFVHGQDMFSLTAMRGSLKLEKENGVFVFNIQIDKSISLSTESNKCETSRAQYPDNMQGAALAKRMTEQGCVTPYLKKQNATCKTIENANNIHARMAKCRIISCI